MTRLPVLIALVALVGVAACGGEGDLAEQGRNPDFPTTSQAETDPTTPATEPMTSPTASGGATEGSGDGDDGGDGGAGADGTVIVTGDSDFGEMLFDERGQAIYLFEPESDGTPACYGECEDAWPPVLTDGDPVGERDVQDGLLDTVQREDGSSQVTYNGWPLYFYAHEEPGQVLCHDVVLNGGLWLAVGPDGDPLPA